MNDAEPRDLYCPHGQRHNTDCSDCWQDRLRDVLTGAGGCPVPLDELITLTVNRCAQTAVLAWRSPGRSCYRYLPNVDLGCHQSTGYARAEQWLAAWEGRPNGD
jgi:hypothetical protein